LLAILFSMLLVCMFALRNEGTKTLLKKKSPDPEELFGIVIKSKNIIILKKKIININFHCKIRPIYVFNKINQELLYVLINNNKFVNINLRLSHEAKIKMYIKIFNLMSHVTFQFFLI
jgi:hypothetical protein